MAEPFDMSMLLNPGGAGTAMAPGGFSSAGGGWDKAGKMFTDPSFLYLISSLGKSLATPGGYPDALSGMGMGLSQNVMNQELLKQLINSLKGGQPGGTTGLGNLGTPNLSAGMDLSMFPNFQRFTQPTAQPKSWLEVE